MSETLLIFGCFLLGIVLGKFDWLPQVLVEHDPTLQALWMLMGLTGLVLGRDRRLGEILRSVSPRILLLPVATTAGTFAGCAICSLFLAYGIFECLAIGSGFAYYSLSSIFITRELGMEAGAVALLANVFREILTLVFCGLLARFIGPLAIITCGGAASMDTILTVVARHGGKDWIMASIVHGVVLDFSVPFWIAIFCPLARANF